MTPWADCSRLTLRTCHLRIAWKFMRRHTVKRIPFEKELAAYGVASSFLYGKLFFYKKAHWGNKKVWWTFSHHTFSFHFFHFSFVPLILCFFFCCSSAFLIFNRLYRVLLALCHKNATSINSPNTNTPVTTQVVIKHLRTMTLSYAHLSIWSVKIARSSAGISNSQ